MYCDREVCWNSTGSQRVFWDSCRCTLDARGVLGQLMCTGLKQVYLDSCIPSTVGALELEYWNSCVPGHSS